MWLLFKTMEAIFFNPANNMMGINPVSFQPYWDGYSVFKVGADNSIFSNNATGSGSAIFMGQNIYNDGSNYRYTGAASNEAGLIDMRSGLFRFYNAQKWICKYCSYNEPKINSRFKWKCWKLVQEMTLQNC